MILMPADYISMLKKHGNVHVYGLDWICYDFKSAAALHIKSQRQFKISEAKVLEINGNKLGIQTTYAGEYSCHSLLKRGMSWNTFNPRINPMQNCVSSAKRDDVIKLLESIGVPERVNKFYVEAFANIEDNIISSDDDKE